MLREDVAREIIFTDIVLELIRNVKVPMLTDDEEKAVVRKALTEYKSKLENEIRGK